MKTFHIETRQLAQLGVLCINPPPLCGALSWRWSNPINVAHNRSQLDGWLKNFSDDYTVSQKKHPQHF